jgi:hypothetical protein
MSASKIKHCKTLKTPTLTNFLHTFVGSLWSSKKIQSSKKIAPIAPYSIPI